MDVTEPDLRSDHAETALVGALAFHAEAIAPVLAALRSEDFYSPHRANVWYVAQQLQADGDPIDPVRVAQLLASKRLWNPATQRIVQVEMANQSAAEQAPQHAAQIADLARRREIIRATTAVRQLVAEHAGDSAELLIAVLRQYEGLGANHEKRPGTLNWRELCEEFHEAQRPDQQRRWIPSPWWEIDELIGGIYPGRMYTIGGRPGAGKSAAALKIAEHAAVQSRKSVLFFSKEMPTLDISSRLFARGAQIDVSKIGKRDLGDVERGRIADYIARADDPSLRVSAEPVTLEDIKSESRLQKQRSGLDMLCVDYLQLVHSEAKGRNREQEVGRVSRELKALSMELEISVIIPAQLNRGVAARADGRPTMSDLRDSGQIEQDSDVVILLWHEQEDGAATGELTFIVDKNRHGPTGDKKLRWRGFLGDIG